jgi:hypothetical protein
VKVLVNRENEAAAREVLELDARATPDQS